MEVIENVKGGVKLCYNGYKYTKKNNKCTTTRWECSQRRAYNCKGALITDLRNSEVKKEVEHSHDRVDVRVQKTLQSIKGRASGSREKTSTILSQAHSDVPEDIRAEMPNPELIRRNIRRFKRGAVPNEPASGRDIQLPDEFKTTGGQDPRPFMIHDNERAQRILIFTTDDSLRQLCRAKKWFMDGTFSVCPRQFDQIYIIPNPLGDGAITTVYGYLPGRSQAVYEEFLEALEAACTTQGYHPDPDCALVDFEQTISNSVHEKIGRQVQIQRCFYHLCQATWRKIQELGLVNRYISLK